MTTTLDGRTALVTGAGRGIGRAIAIGLGHRGARVGLLARAQPREQIGAPLHDQFTGTLSSRMLITAQTSAESLLARLSGPQSGQIWDVSDPIPDQQT